VKNAEAMERLAATMPDGLRLSARLGEGGMGEVFIADDAELGEVVVKVMHQHLDPDHADRLRMEGEALAQLRSPYVVQLYRWGLAQERPFLVMERLRGQSLGSLISQGTLDAGRAIRIAVDVCRGLAVVHSAGVVHRDIKPDNIFICTDRAVLLDFGVVKLMERVTGIQPLQNPTAEGSAVGTPRYMAPEQARGREVDGRADLYAMGAMLFRMVTGEHLFPSTMLKNLLIDHVLTSPRPPSEVVDGLPEGLDEVVLRALQKEPSERFASAAAMGDALEALLRAPAPSPAPEGAVLETMILDPDEPTAAAPSGTVAMRAPYTHPMPAQPEPSHAPDEVQASTTSSPVAVTEAWDGAPYMTQHEAWVPQAPGRHQAAAGAPSTSQLSASTSHSPRAPEGRRWTLPVALILAVVAFVAAATLAERLL